MSVNLDLLAREWETPAYADALGDIFRSFLAKKARVKGKLDRDVRDPEVLLDVARALDLTPPPERVIKITGSKGKGTASRLVAHYLRALATGDEKARVGLYVSPEEFAHTDRMTISGRAVTQDAFAAVFDRLRPALVAPERSLGPDAYLSPFGLFTLVALSWFKDEGVDWHVLETGRGARHDEVGRLDARLSIVTSIFNEHPTYLGPTLADIAADKLSIAETCTQTLVSAQARACATECGVPLGDGVMDEDASLPLRRGLPRWFALDDRLARQAVAAVLGVEDDALLAIDVDHVSASWGRGEIAGVEAVYDALIAINSLDRAWLEPFTRDRRVLVALSLPDDKDRDRIIESLEALGNVRVREVVLTGERGHLTYDRTEARPESMLARVHYLDRDALRAALEDEIARERPDVVYCAGTQTYVRLVKSALLHAPAARRDGERS